MLARIFALSVAITVLGLTPVVAAPPTFQAGEDAYVALHFAEARAAYQAAAVAGAPRDRAESLRQLGVMAWRIDGRPGDAERYFRDAIATGVDISETQAEFARFLSSQKRFDDASNAADAALAGAGTPSDRHVALHACAIAVLDRLDGVRIGDQSPSDVQRLRHVREAMRLVSAAPPMPLDLSEDLLEVALRLDDGPLALAAWLSYAREGAESGKWATAAQKLRAALPAWRPGASPEVRRDVFEGLRISQFFALAALAANDDRFAGNDAFLKAPNVQETLAYATLLKDMQVVTNDYYRDIANKRGDNKAWRQMLIGIAQAFWAKLNFGGAVPAFSPDAFMREIRSRFGGVINVGDTGGVENMHFGHVFIDDQHAVDQYGRHAVLRLIVLDRMVSNGYESWVWDGRQAHGGWSNDEGIFQVRPRYADGPLKSWERLTDPAQRAEIENEVRLLSAGDDEIARADPASFLPGLSLRLRWSGLNALADNLRKAGFAGTELKRRFMLDLSRITLDSSIFAHEGRHALDKIYVKDAKLESEELEFRAKLSEVAFSESPRLSFGSIFNPNTGDATSPHGRANKRIDQGLVAWMDAHRSEIAGLDPGRPLLPQFDKLSDDQMRSAMRSMDPWAPH
ncbi:MAG: hypothetical protein GC190_03570 [Alphaproteobacteria bacterium]|nr:hypothetical protein [Alphaproteobacteria bacterium]